eukprot:746336-Hanusia_phi.AAC.2
MLSTLFASRAYPPPLVLISSPLLSSPLLSSPHLTSPLFTSPHLSSLLLSSPLLSSPFFHPQDFELAKSKIRIARDLYERAGEDRDGELSRIQGHLAEVQQQASLALPPLPPSLPLSPSKSHRLDDLPCADGAQVDRQKARRRFLSESEISNPKLLLFLQCHYPPPPPPPPPPFPLPHSFPAGCCSPQSGGDLRSAGSRHHRQTSI